MPPGSLLAGFETILRSGRMTNGPIMTLMNQRKTMFWGALCNGLTAVFGWTSVSVAPQVIVVIRR